MFALGVVVSLVLWLGEAQYTIWKVAFTWGIVIITIDVVMFLNTKLVKRPKKVKPSKHKAEETPVEEVLGDNPTDIRISWDAPSAPKIERMENVTLSAKADKAEDADLKGGTPRKLEARSASEDSGNMETEPLVDQEGKTSEQKPTKPALRLKKPSVAKPTPKAPIKKEKTSKKKAKASAENKALESDSFKENPELLIVMPEPYEEKSSKNSSKK